jgi:hypothetical protein
LESNGIISITKLNLELSFYGNVEVFTNSGGGFPGLLFAWLGFKRYSVFTQVHEVFCEGSAKNYHEQATVRRVKGQILGGIEGIQWQAWVKYPST